MDADVKDRELRNGDWFLCRARQPGPHVQLGAIPHSIMARQRWGLRDGEYVIQRGKAVQEMRRS
jgi:hypothetical protein